jgi:hypothetical protein
MEKKLTAELTDTELKSYADKADELAIKKGVSKVFPVVQVNPDTFERAVCYLSEPNYSTKIRVMDKATSSGIYTAADELREAVILKEDSDSITFGDSPECDPYKMGVTDFCLGMINRYQNQFKKK